MAIDRRSNSRFEATDPILSRDGLETFGLMNKFRFLNKEELQSNEIATIIITPYTAGRPDLLANVIYGNVNLMWIPIIFNKVQNPLSWPVNNQIVEYPIKSVVFAEL